MVFFYFILLYTPLSVGADCEKSNMARICYRMCALFDEQRNNMCVCVCE